MRPTALIPAVLTTIALILAFLCLFAGHKPGAMESYHLLTLNTSRVGETFLSSNRDESSGNSVTDFFNGVANDASDAINDQIGDTKERLGIQDFYSAHMLDYCFGSETQSGGEEVKGCSETKAMYRFDPTAIIQRAIDKSGLPITLKDLKWPEDIQDGIDLLNTLLGAMFVLYVVSIVLIFASLVASLYSAFTGGRLSAGINVALATLSFVVIAIASALVTAVMVKGENVINDKGDDIGLEAKRGGKFLALTWSATGIMGLVVLAWVFEMVMGRRRKNMVYAKHG